MEVKYEKVVVFLFGNSGVFSVRPMTTLAVETENQLIQELDTIQQEIDSIFTELNEMVAEEKMIELLMKENEEMGGKLAAVKAENDLRQQYLESRLESLGVNTIDPDNPDDMAVLEEVMLGNSGASVLSIPDPPDLETFANCYTLRHFISTTTVDGTSYRFSYIYVTDDKGYSGSPLTCSQTSNKLIGRESTVLRDILDYQFSFGFSSYLGIVPGGWVADWAIGTVCAALESFDENSVISYTGNDDIYNMSMLSVTQMMYVYVYKPDICDWRLCGTSASNISYTRAEYVIANVAGKAVSDAKDYPTMSSSTGSGARTYVRTYIQDGYHDIDPIGFFTVQAYNGVTISFTPGFASYPGQLV